MASSYYTITESIHESHLSHVHKCYDLAFLSIHIIWESLKNYSLTIHSHDSLVLHDSITAFESSLFVATINFLNKATVSTFYRLASTPR